MYIMQLMIKSCILRAIFEPVKEPLLDGAKVTKWLFLGFTSGI